MFAGLLFEPTRLPGEAEALRAEVRNFVARELPSGYWPNSDFNEGHSPAFSRRLGERGWIGMTWPKRFGGGERTFFERYVVTEELLAAG
ncbi:MAG: acyl-CoA dehydrogenase family protein, partial [Gammaproteobacteria bacterium]|nr:acyl-CoA dehydrogenase family protein [Gammaproteobacteria bacterium]